MSSPFDRFVTVRLSSQEDTELLTHAAEIQQVEQRRVTKSEVFRRRAFGSLPIPVRKAA